VEFLTRTRLGRFEPNADVFLDEDAGRVVVTVEIAGADPETLRIEVDERDLLITGRRLEPIRLRHGSFTQKEIAYGEFFKRVHLPAAVEYDGVTASYDGGVLIVAAPVTETGYLPTLRTELHIIVKRTHS
jgi:HSP20 family protein